LTHRKIIRTIEDTGWTMVKAYGFRGSRGSALSRKRAMLRMTGNFPFASEGKENH
jgi:hypothetical protein